MKYRDILYGFMKPAAVKNASAFFSMTRMCHYWVICCCLLLCMLSCTNSGEQGNGDFVYESKIVSMQPAHTAAYASGVPADGCAPLFACDGTSVYFPYRDACDSADAAMFALPQVYQYMPETGESSILPFDKRLPGMYGSLRYEDGRFFQEIEAFAAADAGAYFAAVYSYSRGDGAGHPYAVLLQDRAGEILYEYLGDERPLPQGSSFSLFLTEDCRCLLAVDAAFLVIEPDGTISEPVDIPVVNGFYSTISIDTAADGTVFLSYFDSQTQAMGYRSIDLSAGTLGDFHAFPFSAKWNERVQFAEGHDFYNIGPGGVYSFDDGMEDKQRLFDWIDVQLVWDEVKQVFVQDADHIMVCTYDAASCCSELAVIKRVSRAERRQKAEIVLACADNSALRRQMQLAARRFHRENDAYQITVRYYDTASEHALSAEQQIANDLMRGIPIDGILFSGGITMEYFSHLGVLGDWYPWMDADDSYSRDAFLPCILRAYETAAGQLPVLTTDFSLTLLAGRDADVGVRDRWDYTDFADFLTGLSDGQAVFPLYVSEEDDAYPDCALALRAWLPLVLDDYIDEVRGTCSFASERFRELLRLCERISVKRRYPMVDLIQYAMGENLDSIFTLGGAYYRSYLQGYTDGETVLFNAYNGAGYGAQSIRNAQEFLSLYLLWQTEDISLIGYPLPDDSGERGIAVYPHLQFGMTEHAPHPEGYWQFMRVFFAEQAQKTYQYTMADSSYFPCTYEGLSKMLDDGKDKQYRISDSGTLTEPAASDGEIGAMPWKPSYGDALTALLETTTRRYSGNTAVMDIIYEEASYYFNGVRSLDETVKRIQGRAGLYMSEQHG